MENTVGVFVFVTALGCFAALTIWGLAQAIGLWAPLVVAGLPLVILAPVWLCSNNWRGRLTTWRELRRL